MFRLVLSVLFWSQEVVDRYGVMNEEPPYSEAEERTIFIYNVSSINPLQEGDSEYTVINTGSNSFVTKMRIDHVDLLIQQAHDKVVFL